MKEGRGRDEGVERQGGRETKKDRHGAGLAKQVCRPIQPGE